MTAPYPQQGPIAEGMYLKKHYNAGIPAGPTVFDALVTVPSCTIDGEESSGLVAQAAKLADAQAVGTIDIGNKGAAAGAKVAALASKNADYLRDFYDSASILDV